jgi:uncharacterized membrane protein (GlpM family)
MYMDYSLMLIIRGVAGALAVLLVTSLADGLGPKLGGLLAGFPAISSTSLAIMAVSHDDVFASHAALSALFGIVAAYFFVLGFYGGYRARSGTKRQKTLTAILAGFIGYLVAAGGYFLLVGEGTIYNLIPVVACFFVSTWILRRDTTPKPRPEKKRVRLWEHAARALLGAGIVVFATALADFFGPAYGGMFSTFPGVALLVLGVIALTHSREFFIEAMRYLPAALLASGVYSLSVWYFYPISGILTGTFISLISYIAAIILLSTAK